jgi:hypothetical protein
MRLADCNRGAAQQTRYKQGDDPPAKQHKPTLIRNPHGCALLAFPNEKFAHEGVPLADLLLKLLRRVLAFQVELFEFLLE